MQYICISRLILYQSTKVVIAIMMVPENLVSDYATADDMPLLQLLTMENQQSTVTLPGPPVPVVLPDGRTLPSNGDVKQETDVEERDHEMALRRYQCRFPECKIMFKSLYQFNLHILTHKIQCGNCRCEYKTWKELDDHEDYCARRFGRTMIEPRLSQKAPQHAWLPYRFGVSDIF